MTETVLSDTTPITACTSTMTRPSRAIRPDEVNAFRNVSLAWGAHLVLRSAVRLATLSNGDVDAFILVNLLTGVPFTAPLMGEWGEAIRLLEAAA